MMKPFRQTSDTACKLIVALFALCVVHGAVRGQILPSFSLGFSEVKLAELVGIGPGLGSLVGAVAIYGC